MRSGILAAIAVCVFTSLSSGQEAGPEPRDEAPNLMGSAIYGGPKRFFLSAEYLFWWMKSQPIPTPLVTLASPADTAALAGLQPVAAGTLARPNTPLLFGDQSLDLNAIDGMQLNAFNGMRLSLGWSLDNDARWNIEGSYFVLERRQSVFNPPASPDGSVVYARPIFDTLSGTEIAELDALPGFFTGATSVATSSRLFGWEVNASYSAVRQSAFSWDMLGGFRALDLNEGILIRDYLTQLVPGVLTFQGLPIPGGASLADFDSFGAANHFWGPQIGTRFDWQTDLLHVSLVTKLAMGVTEQIVTINGGTSVLGPGGAAIASQSGGILALPTNIGRHVSDQFAVVPEIGLSIGYRITPQIEARIGYTFLYWSSVARPGNQIDHSVNTGLVPSDPFYGTPGGSNHPVASVSSSDFWAQGINLGLQIDF